MSISSFIYNGFDSFSDCGLYIEQRPAPVRPERDGQFISVPGRNGDVYIDGGRYNNLTIRYNVGCADINTYLPAINKMLNTTGYQKLSDTYDTTSYRMAICTNAVEFQEDLLNFGHAVIEFICEPFRYLTSGNAFIQGNQKGRTVTNTTDYEALPLIKLVGTQDEICSLSVGSKSFSFKMAKAYMYIDSENFIFYNESKAGIITDYTSFWNSDSFPVLNPGENNISVVGSITDVRIKPRWRTL